jgi:gliding motility-associated-like protein
MAARHLFLFGFFAAGCGLYSSAQPQTYNWYFGKYAGLDFSSGGPVPINGGKIQSAEACAAISDKKGKLLFYTDGMTVWNAAHSVMMNGAGLEGEKSSTQGALILQKPGSKSQYYLFTLDCHERNYINGLRYSLIDMQWNGGLGKVIEKNVLLYAPSTEKMTATYHKNGKDIWLITHTYRSDSFVSYLITDSAIVQPPVYSRAGRVLGDPTDLVAAGQMKISYDGEILASVNSNSRSIDIFSFDNATGELQYDTILSTNQIYPANGDLYGLEFSPDNQHLYCTSTYGVLYQYNLSADRPIKIKSSWFDKSQSQVILGALQVGSDGSIYMARYLDKTLGRIVLPNEEGLACEFVPQGVKLLNNGSFMGLPNFFPSYFVPGDSIYFSDICGADSVAFRSTSYITPLHFSWDFGDPASGSNFSTEPRPKHKFTKSGTYTVTLRLQSARGDTTKIERIIYIPEGLSRPFSGKTVYLCEGESVTLDAENPGASYQWSTGEKVQTIKVNASAWYHVVISKNGCDLHDSVEVQSVKKPALNLPETISKCTGGYVVLDPGGDSLQYTWSNGARTKTISVNEPGIYYVTARNGACIASDTIRVKNFPYQNISRETKSLCDVETITLSAGEGSNYQWQPGGEIFKSISIRDFGTYRVTYLDQFGCAVSDSIAINEKCRPKIFVPNVFTPDGNGIDDIFLARGMDITEFEMAVYNRWGERVYYSRNISEGWDGSFKGLHVQADVYLYKINYKGIYSPLQYIAGTVQVMR